MSSMAVSLREAADFLDDVERLAELSRKATPGPWIRKWASLDVHHMSGDDALQSQQDIDFAVASCQYVRDLLEMG